MMFLVFCSLLLLPMCLQTSNADVFLSNNSDVLIETPTTLPPPPKPYSFSYSAGRAPGHTDRVHAEVGDGTGLVRGMYSYIDPRQKVLTVNYEADKNGFRATITNPVQETKAVAAEREKHAELYARVAAGIDQGPPQTNAVRRATARHAKLYNRIAAEHARIAAETAANDNFGMFDKTENS